MTLKPYVMRGLFLVWVVYVLFVVKLVLVSNMLSPIIYPDELVYGGSGGDAWGRIVDFSVYSIVPRLFGYNGALFFNAFITSACAIPIFYLLRRHTSERNAAILCVLISCFAPLWVYSLVNMTEALLYFGILNTALLQNRFSFYAGLHNILIKPIGVAATLANFKYGFYIALFGGLAWSLPFTATYVQAPFQNLILCALRSIWYVLFASLGIAFVTLYRHQTGKGDNDDRFAIMLLFITFAILFTAMVKLPHDKFYGRYFDAPILLLLTTAPKVSLSTIKEKWFKIFLWAAFFIALIYPLLTGFTSGGIMDAGLMPFTEAIKQALWLSNPAFPKP